MRESTLKRNCLRWLRARGAKVIPTTGVDEAGTPDLLGCWQGRCFAFELKVPGRHARPLQEHRLREWSAAGALVGVVHSLEELADLWFPDES